MSTSDTIIELPESDTITEPSESDTSYNYLSHLRKELFKAAMNRNWYKVLELYTDERVQGEHITRANDTLLHVAVSGATKSIILDLLDKLQLNKERAYKILSLKNKNGDTPLHLAAALGLKKVCRRMTRMCPEMVTSERNNLHETPLFSAVRHGKKNAFFVLEVAIHMEQNLKIDEDCLSKRDLTHCTRHDGNNILHYAIEGEQLDLAHEIICLYPSLVNYVNSNGETALHTLANKPSVFKSGAHFGLYESIIYYCTFTKPLKYQFPQFLDNEKKKKREKRPFIPKDESRVLPPTYQVCIDLFSMMKSSIRVIIILLFSVAGAQKEDDELNDEYIKPSKNQEHRRPNYPLTIFVFKIIVKLLSVTGIGKYWRGQTIANLKQMHRNALEIMEVLVDHSTLWVYEEEIGGMEPAKSSIPYDKRKSPPSLEDRVPYPSEDETILIKAVKEVGIDLLKIFLEKNSLRIVEEKESTDRSDTESPVLVAAEKGITEMVERILGMYPVAIFDQDKDSKNIVLLAVEHRRVHVYDYMRSVSNMESVFWKLDKEGNSALHLAAMLSDRRLWSTGAALHIQWEIKWYKYVRSSMGRERSVTTNNAGKMPEEVFIESHDALIKDGITGLTNTCQSCSVVAALFATVAFQSVSTVPGGVDQQSGFPILSKRPVFEMFAISSLLALCFSVTSVVMFLAILISDFKVWDFERRLPVKLILGLTSLFMTIAFTLVAFCAGDFYVIQTNLKFAAYPIYAIMCFPVTYFAVAQYPLYINLIKQTIKKIAKPEMVQGYIS